MYVPINDRGDEEIFDDLMDEIDPDLEYAPEILFLAGRVMQVALSHGTITNEAEYERAIVRSAELAYGEWIV